MADVQLNKISVWIEQQCSIGLATQLRGDSGFAGQSAVFCKLLWQVDAHGLIFSVPLRIILIIVEY
jgi:hypothetical protein